MRFALTSVRRWRGIQQGFNQIIKPRDWLFGLWLSLAHARDFNTISSLSPASAMR